MWKRPLCYISSIVLAGLLGYIQGRREVTKHNTPTRFQGRSAPKAHPVLPRDQASSSQKNEHTISVNVHPADPFEIHSEEPVDFEPEFMLPSGPPDQWLGSFLRSPELIERWTGLFHALQKLDVENGIKTMQVFQNLPPGTEKTQQFDLFLHSWGTLAGSSALEAISEEFEEPLRQKYLLKALSGWASVEPKMALAWVDQVTTPERSSFLVSLIEGMAAEDPYAASDILTTLPFGPQRAQAADLLIKRFEQEGVHALIDWISTIQDPHLRKGIVRMTAENIGESAPKEAAAWLRHLYHDEERETAVNALARTWGTNHPEAAIVWASGLSDPILRNNAIVLVIDRWSIQDPMASGDWLNDHVGDMNLDKAIARYAYRFQKLDPEYALDWAYSIDDQASRDKTVSNLSALWMSSDPAAAKAYFEE